MMKEKLKNMIKDKLTMPALIPVIMFLLFVAIFAAATGGNIVSAYSMRLILRYSIPMIIGGLGMIFVVSQGSIDISMGATAALSSSIGVRLALATAHLGNGVSVGLFFAGAMITGLTIGTLLGVIVSRFKVSSFMASLSLLIGVRGLVNAIIGQDILMCTPAMLKIRNYEIYILIGLIIIMGYIFKYTRLGYFSKAIGENEVAVSHVGISTKVIKMSAFMLSGLMAGIVGVFLTINSGGANNLMGTFFELKVLMALFVGGIPVSGGMKTKLYKMIIGVPTILLLENGLVMIGVGGEIYQAIQGVVLVSLVLMTLMLNRRAEDRALRLAQQALKK